MMATVDLVTTTANEAGTVDIVGRVNRVTTGMAAAASGPI